jgi:hypothetical protein
MQANRTSVRACVGCGKVTLVGKNTTASQLAGFRLRQFVKRHLALRSWGRFVNSGSRPAGTFAGAAILVGTKARWAATRRGCGSLICSILVQAVCSTCGVRRSPRTSINAVMTAMRRSSHSEALRMYHSSSRSFSTSRQHARCWGVLGQPCLTWSKPAAYFALNQALVHAKAMRNGAFR